MARTPAGTALTEQHRRMQLALRAATLRDLRRIWPAFDPTDFDTFERVSAAATVLIRARHRDSAGVAARYFLDFRAAEGALGEPPVPFLPPPLADDVTAGAVRATGLVGVLNARRTGQSIEMALDNGFVRLAGQATSLVLRGGRDTITGTAARDPQVARWRRVTAAKPCDFCSMLASRGAVYRPESARFQAHAHCACMAEPAFT